MALLLPRPIEAQSNCKSGSVESWPPDMVGAIVRLVGKGLKIAKTANDLSWWLVASCVGLSGYDVDWRGFLCL